MSPLRYELGFYIPEDDILHSHCRENLKTWYHGDSLQALRLQLRFFWSDGVYTWEFRGQGWLLALLRWLSREEDHQVGTNGARFGRIGAAFSDNMIVNSHYTANGQHPAVHSSGFTEKLGCWESFMLRKEVNLRKNKQKTNSVTLSPQANFTGWATATCRRNSVPTFADRGVSRGQRGWSPTAVNLSFVDRSRYYSFK
jgi:hypothetical protein